MVILLKIEGEENSYTIKGTIAKKKKILDTDNHCMTVYEYTNEYTDINKLLPEGPIIFTVIQRFDGLVKDEHYYSDDIYQFCGLYTSTNLQEFQNRIFAILKDILDRCRYKNLSLRFPINSVKDLEIYITLCDLNVFTDEYMFESCYIE